ncbi:hypothetical protein [Sulfolobus acidocaldarius]|uniref:Uncharacterized protein n=4 Tax=Sulfolobus acidocaldarius TaxID=2285 RepID=A0A0U2Y2W6_9CREN|nr:hypothetical protein [Sulfolobus acidocaldarius]AAY81308.1 hypothetical membrane protein [Sulfolobus acidocaldarius DSM 639]AGE71948.1 hypothetical protein SacN8_09970 [Sulfolobus acidocaldarius N8]AGE74220.1 hypothetical protein SacRon12I_09990 [Sulfolobus acidocaldarius Ron12/I]ALU29889.1 hypothetical protein ATY89_08025 [Sulfolobus acidocaldarius]ALU32629.1 hypothetical protein ATZ20_11045 [Sulfolobus acidocaldarius]
MPDSNEIEKLVARTRVFLFFSITLLVFGSDIAAEIADNMVYPLDDILVLVLGIVGIVLYFAMRSRSVEGLKRLNNIYLTVFVVALAIKLVWTIIEAPHPDDMADDIPAVIILAVVIANRFF